MERRQMQNISLDSGGLQSINTKSTDLTTRVGLDSIGHLGYGFSHSLHSIIRDTGFVQELLYCDNLTVCVDNSLRDDNRVRHGLIQLGTTGTYNFSTGSI